MSDSTEAFPWYITDDQHVEMREDQSVKHPHHMTSKERSDQSDVEPITHPDLIVSLSDWLKVSPRTLPAECACICKTMCVSTQRSPPKLRTRRYDVLHQIPGSAHYRADRERHRSHDHDSHDQRSVKHHTGYIQSGCSDHQQDSGKDHE